MIKDSDLLVSVQAAGATCPTEGHLSWGVLWSADAILIPDPTAWIEDTPRFEVLVARFDGEINSVTRISPRKVSLLGSSDNTVGLVVLAAPVCEPPNRSVCSDTFTTQIEESGDMWAALEAQNTIPTGLRNTELSRLEELAEIEEASRSQLITDFRRPGSVAWPNPICIFSPNCRPDIPDLLSSSTDVRP